MQEVASPDCISKTVKFRLILGRDIDWESRCVTTWCEIDLTFDLAIVTLNYKLLPRLYLGNYKV